MSVRVNPISGGGLSAPVDAVNIADGSVSDAEFQRLDGVTSSIQSQINGKANTSHTHSASDINSGTLSSSRIPANFTVQVNHSSTVSWDGLPPPTVTADSSGTYVDYPVTGAAVGQRVNVTLRGVTESNIIVRGEVTEANNVRVHYARVSGSTDLTDKIVDISIYNLNT